MGHSIDDVETKVEALNTALAGFMRQDADWKARMEVNFTNHLKHHEEIEKKWVLIYGTGVSIGTALLMKLLERF